MGAMDGMRQMPRKSFDGEPRLHSLNMKTTKELRERLEAAASISGRALTHEVEARLNRTFEYDYLMGEGDTALVLRAMASGIKRFENAMGKKWTEDKVTHSLCYDVAQVILKALMQSEPAENKLIGQIQNPAPDMRLIGMDIAIEELTKQKERYEAKQKR